MKLQCLLLIENNDKLIALKDKKNNIFLPCDIIKNETYAAAVNRIALETLNIVPVSNKLIFQAHALNDDSYVYSFSVKVKSLPLGKIIKTNYIMQVDWSQLIDPFQGYYQLLKQEYHVRDWTDNIFR